jgi:hypothetical protein
MAAITHHHLPADLDSVGGEPDWFTRAQAEFSSGDRNDAAASVRKRLEQADLLSVWRQPESRFARACRVIVSRSCFEARSGKTKFRVGLRQCRLQPAVETGFAVAGDADGADG